MYLTDANNNKEKGYRTIEEAEMSYIKRKRELDPSWEPKEGYWKESYSLGIGQDEEGYWFVIGDANKFTSCGWRDWTNWKDWFEDKWIEKA